MVYTQTVEIPPDRNLHLDLELPKSVDTGKIVRVLYFVDEDREKSSGREAVPVLSKTPITDSFLGTLSGLPDMSAKEIREMRLHERYGE